MSLFDPTRRSLLAWLGLAPASLSSQPAPAQAPKLADTEPRIGISGDGRNALEALHNYLSVRHFGATGDGLTDDTAAIQSAVNAASEIGTNLYFPPGTYRISATIRIEQGNGLGLIGPDYSPMEQGSSGPSVLLKWHGPAAPMFFITISGVSVVGMGFQNFGRATDVFDVRGGQHHLFRRLSFLLPDGSARFSRSIFYMVNASFGYGRWQTIWFGSASEKFIFIDGGTGGGTPIEISERCVFESNAVGPCEILHLRNMSIDSVHMHDNTFDQLENQQLRIVDTRESVRKPAIFNFNFSDNEIDIESNSEKDVMFEFSDVINIKFECNNIQGGSVKYLVALRSSVVSSFHSNFCISVGRAIFDVDATSQVASGVNVFDLPTMGGGVIEDSSNSGLINLAPTAGKALINLAQSPATGNGTYRLTMQRDEDVALIVSIMTDSVRGMPTKGQEFTLQIRNASSRSLGGLTTNSLFKLQAGALKGIAPQTTRNIRMMYDGKSVEQIVPYVDIPL